MIIEINEDLLEEVVKFAWELSCNKNKCGFPKVKSYNEMYDGFLKALRDKDDKVLACFENGEVVGALNLLVENNNNYLESIGGIIAKKDFNSIATQFIDYLKANYSNYKIDFGYPLENEDAINFLKEIKAKLIDSSLTMELKKDDFVRNSPCKDVILLERDLYEEYAAFHDKYNPQMYWTSERIFDRFDLWKIYIIIEKQKIVGSILIKVYNKRAAQDKQAEIFAMTIDKEYKHQGLELILLSESIYDIFTQGKENILYFVDEDAIDELQAASKAGFKQIDSYRCYKLNL